MELLCAFGYLLGMVACLAMGAAPIIIGLLIYLNVRKIAKNTKD